MTQVKEREDMAGHKEGDEKIEENTANYLPK